MAHRPFNSYGADVEDILKIAQGVQQLQPDDLNEKLNQYFKLINNNQLEEAKVLQKELQQMTDRQHPDILKGQTLIDFKEIVAE